MSNENTQTTCGLPAGEWWKVFCGARVELERLERSKNDRGRATIMGNFLGRQINREVSIEVNDRVGKATLRWVPGRSAKKLYYFEIAWDDEQPVTGNQTSEDLAADGRPQPAQPAVKPTRTDLRSTPPQERPSDSPTGPGSAEANNEQW